MFKARHNLTALTDFVDSMDSLIIWHRSEDVKKSVQAMLAAYNKPASCVCRLAASSSQAMVIRFEQINLVDVAMR